MNEDIGTLAGEYVLGLLEGEEKAAADARLQTDTQFRDAVESFSAKMNALDMTAVPASAPHEMWHRIEAAIGGMSQDRPGATVIPLQTPVSRTFAPRWMALAASLIVGVSIGYLGGWMTVSRPEPVVLVVLDTQENVPGAIFEAFADNSVRIVPLQDFTVPEGKIMQVWTLYDKGVGPVSLGTLPRAGTATLEGQAFPVPAENQLYEITLEPLPASPTGKPTGPILVKGFAKRPVHST